MKPFIFSADGHIKEPNDLFENALPASMKAQAIKAERRGDYICTVTGDKIIHRHRLPLNMQGDFGGRKRLGLSNLEGRLVDLAEDGVDAEIVFPTLGLWTYVLEDPELELATAEIYNDWNSGFFANHLDIFVRCGILPVRDLANAERELKRIAAMGFTAAMLPGAMPKGIPAYNSEQWDPIFALAAELGIVFVLHTGTGLESVVVERGPGAAVINYANQMRDAQKSVMYLVAGGVLDRNPKTQIAVIESGASWLAALAERMDEVYLAHDIFVKPKLTSMPSEIIRRQVKASFQFDRACVMSRSVTGHEALIWGSDYPHSEGTFPNSREVVTKLFEGIDITEKEKADILGGNAARLFRLPRPEFVTASA